MWYTRNNFLFQFSFFTAEYRQNRQIIIIGVPFRVIVFLLIEMKKLARLQLKVISGSMCCLWKFQALFVLILCLIKKDERKTICLAHGNDRNATLIITYCVKDFFYIRNPCCRVEKKQYEKMMTPFHTIESDLLCWSLFLCWPPIILLLKGDEIFRCDKKNILKSIENKIFFYSLTRSEFFLTYMVYFMWVERGKNCLPTWNNMFFRQLWK